MKWGNEYSIFRRHCKVKKVGCMLKRPSYFLRAFCGTRFEKPKNSDKVSWWIFQQLNRVNCDHSTSTSCPLKYSIKYTFFKCFFPKKGINGNSDSLKMKIVKKLKILIFQIKTMFFLNRLGHPFRRLTLKNLPFSQ